MCKVVTVQLLHISAVQILAPKLCLLQHKNWNMDTFRQCQEADYAAVTSCHMRNADDTPAQKVTHLKELIVVLLHFHIADGAYKMPTRGDSQDKARWTVVVKDSLQMDCVRPLAFNKHI